MDSDTGLKWVDMICTQFRFQKVMTKDLLLRELRVEHCFEWHIHTHGNWLSTIVVKQSVYATLTLSLQTQWMLTAQMPMNATFDQPQHPLATLEELINNIPALRCLLLSTGAAQHTKSHNLWYIFNISQHRFLCVWFEDVKMLIYSHSPVRFSMFLIRYFFQSCCFFRNSLYC